MPYLTYADEEGNKPIAIIEGGSRHGDIVYISEKVGGVPAPSRVDYSTIAATSGKNSRGRATIQGRLEAALRTEEDVEEDLKPFLELAKQQRSSGVEIDIPDGILRPIPNTSKDRDVIYAYGASGSGKTTAVADFAKRWKKLHPKGTVYVYSQFTDNDGLEGLKPLRLPIDDLMLEDHITCDDFDTPAFVIFDDIDSLPKKQYDGVQAILTDLLNRGRHHEITVAVTSHLGTDYKRTRGILNETKLVVAFPHGAGAKANRYVMCNYCGLSSKDVDKVLALPSRWVAVKRTYPPCIMHEHGVYLLSPQESKKPEKK